VVDIFYVTESDDTKPATRARSEQVKARLMAALNRPVGSA
jgi:hypothetical protein